MTSIAKTIAKELGVEYKPAPSFCINNPLGIEIEVKWRDYFPQLWSKYLANSSYNDLSEELQQQLTQECNKEEELLLPKLNKTIECGIPRGLDKYWEFAFTPSYDIGETIDQVEVLRAANLIPQGNHSFHITLGNMKLTEDAYYLLLLLEVLFIDENRIMSAFNKTNQKISASWARKGMGGLFSKEARELIFNTPYAIELRTLELSDKYTTQEILTKTCFWSEIIIDKQHNKSNAHIELWNKLLMEMKKTVKSYQLTDENWKKPNIEPEKWLSYVKTFPLLKATISELEKDILNYLSSSQKNKIR